MEHNKPKYGNRFSKIFFIALKDNEKAHSNKGETLTNKAEKALVLLGCEKQKTDFGNNDAWTPKKDSKIWDPLKINPSTNKGVDFSICINVYKPFLLYSNYTFLLPLEINFKDPPLKDDESKFLRWFRNYKNILHKFRDEIKDKETIILIAIDGAYNQIEAIATDGAYNQIEAKTTVEFLEKDLKEYLKRKNFVSNTFQKLSSEIKNTLPNIQKEAKSILDKLIPFFGEWRNKNNKTIS